MYVLTEIEIAGDNNSPDESSNNMFFEPDDHHHEHDNRQVANDNDDCTTIRVAFQFDQTCCREEDNDDYEHEHMFATSV